MDENFALRQVVIESYFNDEIANETENKRNGTIKRINERVNIQSTTDEATQRKNESNRTAAQWPRVGLSRLLNRAGVESQMQHE